ncbi:MAG TPA: hypothetical protein V6D29_08045 [Leptolyngbyaceae cyanobacterium]
MVFESFLGIKWQQLFLALAVTFLMADNISHSQAGAGLADRGVHALERLLQPLKHG